MLLVVWCSYRGTCCGGMRSACSCSGSPLSVDGSILSLLVFQSFSRSPALLVAVKSVFWSMALPSGVPAYRRRGVLVVMIQDVIAVTKTQLG